MNDKEYLSFDLYLYDESDKAYLVSEKPDAPPEDRQWLPKSLTRGGVKFAYEHGLNGRFRFFRTQIEEWKARQMDLL